VRAALIVMLLTGTAAADVTASLTIEADLSARRELDDVSGRPDIWFDATDRLTVGVTTSARALSRLHVAQYYDDVAVDGLWKLDPRVSLRARFVQSWDPWRPSLRVGALARWRRGPWAVEGDPHVQLGLANTELGNRAQLDVPVWLRFHGAWLRTGARGELSGFLEKVAIPIGVGGVVHVGRLDLGVEVAFPRLLGPQNEFRSRVGYVYVSTRL